MSDLRHNAAVMSQRHHSPDSLDLFCTPPWAGRALLRAVLLPQAMLSADSHHVIEPAVGKGHLWRPLAEECRQVTISDVHDWSPLAADGKHQAAPILDFAGYGDGEFATVHGDQSCDWVITNPPYVLGEAFFHAAWRVARVGVAFLLRLQWAEGATRYSQIFANRPPTMLCIFSERVPMMEGCWDPDLSSATAYAWFVWLRGTEPRPPFWFPPSMQRTFTRQSDMDLASPGEAKRRKDAKAAEAAKAAGRADHGQADIFGEIV